MSVCKSMFPGATYKPGFLSPILDRRIVLEGSRKTAMARAYLSVIVALALVGQCDAFNLAATFRPCGMLTAHFQLTGNPGHFLDLGKCLAVHVIIRQCR